MSLFEKYTTRWTADSLRIINTPSREGLPPAFFIQETGHFITLSGYYTERADLPSHLIIYTISGMGKLYYENTEYEILPGHAVYIDCKEYHRYEMCGDTNWEFYWVHFGGEAAQNYYEIFRKENTAVTGKLSRTSVPETIRKIVEINHNPDITTELKNISLITDLVTEIITAPMAKVAMKIPEFVKNISEYIEINYVDNITLDFLSKRFSISKYHLSREFKKHIGQSPVEYLIKCRITRAKELLKTTRLSIGEISQKIGISSENHFSAMFKSRTGETPGEFRKLWRSI